MSRIKTPYGGIYYGGSCYDDYATIETYDQEISDRPVKLQGPAMRAFKAAERRYGKRRKTGWRAIPLTGSWRSCEYQADLYASDPDRYASPDKTGHTRGLAIDVRNDLGLIAKFRIRRALRAEGWKQARSDEPWHHSYWISV